jgi:hypothetical protein
MDVSNNEVILHLNFKPLACGSFDTTGSIAHAVFRLECGFGTGKNKTLLKDCFLRVWEYKFTKMNLNLRHHIQTLILLRVAIIRHFFTYIFYGRISEFCYFE